MAWGNHSTNASTSTSTSEQEDEGTSVGSLNYTKKLNSLKRIVDSIELLLYDTDSYGNPDEAYDGARLLKNTGKAGELLALMNELKKLFLNNDEVCKKNPTMASDGTNGKDYLGDWGKLRVFSRRAYKINWTLEGLETEAAMYRLMSIGKKKQIHGSNNNGLNNDHVLIKSISGEKTYIITASSNEYIKSYDYYNILPTPAEKEQGKVPSASQDFFMYLLEKKYFSTKENYINSDSAMILKIDSAIKEEAAIQTSKIKEKIEASKLFNDTKGWYCEKESSGTYAGLSKIEEYYDMLSGMTPFVEANIGGTIINSIYNPYIKSLEVKDTGVKEVNLKLFDPNFGAETIKLDSNGNVECEWAYVLKKNIKDGMIFALDSKGEKIEYSQDGDKYIKQNKGGGTHYKYKTDKPIAFSLEQAIMHAISDRGGGMQTPNQNGRVLESTTNTDTNVKSIKLNWGPDAPNVTVSNLTIRFGYADFNPGINEYDDRYSEYDKVSKKWKNKNGDEVDYHRTNRWWHITNQDSGGNSFKIHSIPENTGKWKSSATYVKNNSESVAGAATDKINRRNQVISMRNNTTVLSTVSKYLIIDYSTSVQKNGIEYTIKGIEIKNSSTLGARFQQKFATLQGTPMQVFSLLSRMFNEDSDKKIIKTSPVRIYAPKDDDYVDKDGVEHVNNSGYIIQEADKTKFSESELSSLPDGFELCIKSKDYPIYSDKIKEISLELGGDDAYKNYMANSKDPTLYKTVAQLMNEYCAACPPKRVGGETVYYQDTEGNTQTKKSGERILPLQWSCCTVGEGNEQETLIFLYYREPDKVEYVRKYTYGVNNPNISCVKSININNSTEYATIAGFNTLTGNNDAKHTRGRNADSLIGSNDFDRAFQSSLYEGTIEVIGDPFYNFDAFMRPYCYPIYVQVLTPIQSNNSSMKDENDTNVNITWRARKGNQAVHQLSGFYVVGEITHNLSKSGYTTTLKIMSYPGIAAAIGAQ